MSGTAPASLLIAEVVDGCEWAFHDRTHFRLYVLHGLDVTVVDTRTGQVCDRWPVDVNLVANLGVGRAAAAAVAERVNRGY